MSHNLTYKKFGDVASFSRGLTFAKGDVAIGSSKKVLRSNNIDLQTHTLNFDDVACLKEEFIIPNEKKLHKGDIFICMSNGSTQHLGKVAFIDKDMDYAFGGFMGVIHPDNTTIYPKYAFYACLSSEYRRFLASIFNGININNLKWSDLSNLQIPIPTLQEQERIVAELDLLAGIIDKQKQQLKELDTLAQSIFYDMFGNPVENEKGWELKSLGDISVKIANGYNAKLEEGTYKTEGVMYFRCQNVWRNRFDYSDLVYIDEQTNAIMKSSSLKKNDFVITKIGRLFTENSSLGRVSLYEGEDDKANISGNLCFVRLKEGVCHKFILYILISEHFRDYVRNTTTGGIDKRALNCKQVASYNVILPPLELQKVFSEKVKAIESQKESINRSIAESQKLFDYTMDKYFG